MLSNLFLDFFILLFVLLSAAIVYKERKTRLGIVVKEDDKYLTSGKQGLETEIGRSSLCDVRLPEKTVSRLQAKASYNPVEGKIQIDEFGAMPGNCSAGYYAADHDLKLHMPIEERCFELGFLPSICAMMIILLQAATSYHTWGTPKAVIPHVILICFLAASYLIRADRTPIIEPAFAIMLTCYIEATMYPALLESDDYESCLTSSIIGVAIYTGLCLAMKLFFWILGKRPQFYRPIRIAACGAIVLLILLNLILAKPINGARNWVNVGSISFQPSEVVKLLLIFVLTVPSEERVAFMKPRNLCIVMGMPIVCMFYALLIKDVGALLMFGVIFIISVLLQNTDIMKNLLIIITAVFSCKLILKISSTAVYRFSNWIGEGTLLEGLTAQGVFNTPYDYGYQSVHSIIAAFKNGGLFGNRSGYDVLSGITAANSDIVTGFLAQKHGFVFLFLVLGLYLVLLGGCFQSLRQQRKTEQVFSLVSVTLILFAAALNICGSYGILALSGVVNPALSDGISAALCYGPLFGAISASGLSHKYLKRIKGEM